MASTPLTPRRRWPRYLFLSAGILLLALVAVLLLAVAANRFDEPLERSTKAWLDYPAPTAPDTQNGYLALLALDAQIDNPIAAAAAMVREEHALFAKTRGPQQHTTPHYDEIRTRLLHPSEVHIPLDSCKDKCYDYILTHGEKLKALSSTHADLLRRYRAMLDSPVYAEDIPRDPRALYPNHGLAYSLGLLYLGDLVSAMQKGDAQAAYQSWARHQRFWQMAATGSVTLLDIMRAVAELERNQTILSDMLKAHPQSIAIARRQALPILTNRPLLAPLVARSMVFEFQMQAYVFSDMIYDASLFKTGDEQEADLRDRLALLFYQRNASLNLLHRLHQNDLSQNGVALGGNLAQDNSDAQNKVSCTDQRNWHLLVNPVGKILLCRIGSYDMHRYHERAAKADAATNALIQTIQAMR
jgi:hypothetical protein